MDITAKSIVTNSNEYAYLLIDYENTMIDDFNNKLDSSDPDDFSKNYILRITFSGDTNAWASGVGLPIGTTYSNYPCIVTGTVVTAVVKIRCDLIAKGTNSYVDIYGFKTELLINPINIHIELPNIKIANIS